MQEAYHDGVLWAPLGNKARPLDILKRWGALLGVPYRLSVTLLTEEEWIAVLRMIIGSRSMLLVFDDVWQMESAMSLTVGGPNCTYLLTSRNQPLARAFAPEATLSLSELREEASHRILKLLARTAIERHSKETNTLVDACGGLALALVLSGLYLYTQGYDGQSRRLKSAFDRFRDPDFRLHMSTVCPVLASHPSMTSRTISLYDTFALSTDALSDSARFVLYTLAQMPHNPISLTQIGGETRGEIERELDELTDAGLLQSVGDGRYKIHPVIADFARLLSEYHEKTSSPPFHALAAVCLNAGGRKAPLSEYAVLL